MPGLAVTARHTFSPSRGSATGKAAARPTARWLRAPPRTAALAHPADRRFDVGIVLAPDADLVARAGAPRALDDQTRLVVWQGILMGAGLGHAVAALRHDAAIHQGRHDLTGHRG